LFLIFNIYLILFFYKYIGKHQETKPNYKRDKEKEGSFPLAREEERKEEEENGMLPE
jgi:hypothetical protein